MTARTLAINCFTSADRHGADTSGLGLLLGIWLGIARPQVHIGSDGRYLIRCATPADAEALCSNFGGTVHGARVTGYVVDLTG